MNKKPLIPLILFVLFASLACNLLSPGAIEQAVKDAGEGVAQTAIVKGQSTVQAMAGTAVAEAQTPQAAPTQAPSEPGSAPLESLSNVNAGADQLDSYRLFISVKTTGKDSQGQDQTGSIVIEEVKIKATGDSSMKMTTEGTITGSSPGSDVEIYSVAGVMYTIVPGDQPTCTSISDASGVLGATNLVAATGFFNNLSSMKLAERSVSISGIKADHYTFDETAFPAGQYQSANGDVWVAQEGGYVVKLAGTANGQIPFEGNNIDGTMEWSYELQDINQVTEITVPDYCTAPAGASGEIPIPENATEQNSVDKILTFKSPDAPKVVSDFYLTKLAELGWTVETNNAMDPVYLLSFTKEDKRLDITISGDASGATVMIVQGP